MEDPTSVAVKSPAMKDDLEVKNWRGFRNHRGYGYGDSSNKSNIPLNSKQMLSHRSRLHGNETFGDREQDVEPEVSQPAAKKPRLVVSNLVL